MYPSNPCLLDLDGATSVIAINSSAFKSNVTKFKPIKAPQIPTASPNFFRGNASFSFLKNPFIPSSSPPSCSSGCLVHYVPNSGSSRNQWRADGNFYPLQNSYGNQPRCDKPRKLVPPQFLRSNYFQDVEFIHGSTYPTKARVALECQFEVSMLFFLFKKIFYSN